MMMLSAAQTIMLVCLAGSMVAPAAAGRKLGQGPAASTPACTGSTFSKQSCSFSNVCFMPSSSSSSSQQQVTVVWSGRKEHAATLAAHLGTYLQHVYASVQYNSSANTTGFQVEHAVTMLWRVSPNNQQSFGHALVNEVLPIFLVLSDQEAGDIPRSLQLLVTPDWQHHVLQHLIRDTISHRTALFKQRLSELPAGTPGLCFRQVIIGDGGYVAASRASLANSNRPEAHQFAVGPSFFNSRNWWAFRKHALQVAGVEVADERPARPLVLLNDKRYRAGGAAGSLHPDRRMILDIEQLAGNISAAFPQSDVAAVRFRDLAWPEQLRMLAAAKVLITTQGSSAFRLVFLPKGSVCIVVGSPTLPDERQWRPFHELDRWFPLSYVSFARYEVSIDATQEYDATPMPGWRPPGAEAAHRWDLYNAAIRVNATRLEQHLRAGVL